MKWALPALCAGCATMLLGCTVLPEMQTREPVPWVQAGSPQPASDVDSLVQYYQYIRKLSAAELGREHDAARQAYNRTRSDFSRVRFSLLLSLPNTPFHDEARALDLLDPVTRNASGALQGLAQLLSMHLQERKQLNVSVQGLQQKLDALRSLERSIIERAR